MAAGNEVTIVGNVVSSPDEDLRVTNSGKSVLKFGVAWNRRWQQDGEWQEEPHFFDVTVFGDMADNVADSVSKGSRVVVVGRLTQDRWEDKEGQQRTKVALVADEVAVSMRWAKVDITKTGGGGRDDDRRGSSGGRDDYAGMNERGGRNAPNRDSGGRGRYDDEVPF
jgi:single-strand DNA-binding protein